MVNRLAQKWRGIVEAWRDYPLQPGKLWNGRYRIERLLGMGSYGQAYLCIDLETNEQVLLKRNKPSKGQTGIELLRRESEIMSALDHPQIPKRLAYSRRRRDEALIMQYVNGHNLEYMIYEQNETYSEAEALKMLQLLLKPIRYLHEQGYVHRDVRIPNVLLQGGLLHLVDFGLACRIGERLPEHLLEALGEGSGLAKDSAAAVKRRMRTPAPASDWFGLGHLFLFVMYAGYEPAAGAEEKSWEAELELQPEVKHFVGKLLNDEYAWVTTEQCERELAALLDRLNER
ncbi:protein kinase family protein [Paenibacillus nanensis]|uniref:Protein kinase family protein n=1 Tax=Paenibacillus nanensis TaxID=393251 RepID=A0A3A1VIF6_9BACL|nr:protein kinase [Paenibacillus nanensis]RIX60241.1 protein kinase family protein [Paenibacillus nanensis]